MQLFVYGSAVLLDSISTFFFLNSNTFVHHMMQYATPLLLQLKYALSHSIGINVANVGLKSFVVCLFCRLKCQGRLTEHSIVIPCMTR